MILVKIKVFGFINCVITKESCIFQNDSYLTRMTTFIKTKFNKSGDQTNIDNIE